MAGRPRRATIASSSRTTRKPGKEVSATSARHSRVKSSTTERMRKRRPSTKASDRKSRLQRWFGPLRYRQRRPCAKCPFTSASSAHLQPFLTIEAAELLVVHGQTLATHQHEQAAIAEPSADCRQLAKAGTHGGIGRPAASITERGAIHPEHRTRPSLAHLERTLQVSDGLSPGGGRHHFFEATSLSMALSSIASAKSFFSFAFSSSSAFSRLASDTSRPPYFAFHL
ncbi:hypothetical protein ACVWYQ_006552 [Bradyrhizobium sp. USDA 3397]